jgi:hypothetical protein
MKRKSRRIRWVGHVARMGRREIHRISVRRYEGKRSLARERSTRDGNGMHFKGIGHDDLD